jgi:hypothetical protein
LYAESFFVTLFLLKRVDAVFELPAQFAGFIAGFGKGYFGVAP